MPLSNGDSTANGAEALDFTKALEVLQNEYPERDGIDIKTLIDSKKNGGLTYNDFLMLPGYIGAFLLLVMNKSPPCNCSLVYTSHNLLHVLGADTLEVTPSIQLLCHAPFSQPLTGYRLPCRCSHPRYPNHEAHYPQNPVRLIAHGHRH